MTLLLDAAGHPVTAPSLSAVARGQDAPRDEYMPDNPVDAVTYANWRQRLRMVSPHHDNLSFLYLMWEPGWPWEPVGRHMLFECLPIQFVDPELVMDLQCEDPAKLTTHDAMTGEISQKTLVTAMQWRIYRETGRYGRPFWVIQGDNGGHKVFLSDTEKKLLKMAGYPDAFPSPGELPYAPFDNRVIDHVVRHDKLQRANGDVKRMARMAATGNTDRAKALRREVVKWLGEQMEESAKTLVKQLHAADVAQDRTQLTPEGIMDERTEEYVEHGRFLDVR
jgi:hypothetical protein